MKKITAILLMGLLSFNWFGYKLVVNYFQNEADRHLESRIDLNEYDESQLIEIRTALNMPYQTNNTDFERCYGEIEIEGKIYTYVKRRVENGFLILQCIPNIAKQNIEKADDDIFNANNGLAQENSSGKKDSPVKSINKSFFSIYDDYSAKYALEIPTYSLSLLFSRGTNLLNNIDLPVSEQPPETT